MLRYWLQIIKRQGGAMLRRIGGVGSMLSTAWRWFVIHLPGSPAFTMSDRSQKKEAFFRFMIAVFFSISPMILIVFLDAISQEKPDLGASALKYTEAGQVYFYVGAVLGSAFILVRDNFREDHRKANLSALTNGERRMRTERTWFMTYLYAISVGSVIILCVHHLKTLQSRDLIYWSSALIYVISLYVWYLDILYSRVGASDSDDVVSTGAAGVVEPLEPDPALTRINDSLAGMGNGGSR